MHSAPFLCKISRFRAHLLKSRGSKNYVLIPLAQLGEDNKRFYSYASKKGRTGNNLITRRLGRARFYSTAASSSSSSSDSSDGTFITSEDYPNLNRNLETYSRYQPCPISIAHFLEFGRNASLQSSFMFLRREVPVRIANIMKELQLMPAELRETRGCRVVTQQYAQSFQEVTAFEKLCVKEEGVLQDFTSALMTIRERHADTVIAMAEAVMELKIKEKQQGTNGGHLRPKFEKNIQYFLDRLYTSRISTRMLINQHTLLFDEPDVS